MNKKIAYKRRKGRVQNADRQFVQGNRSDP